MSRGCTILACILAALLAASWFAIDFDEADADRYPGGVVLRNAAGDVMRVALGPGDVDCRPYYRAGRDDWIVKALVAVEDGTYFEHCGVRPLSILRAAFQNVFYRRRISGASTITMQAVRLIRPHPRSLWWKYREAVMALKLERRHDKLWILSQYLNRAPFGSNFVGIESAASGWFGKEVKNLGIGEAALLAGMVQAPSRLRPDRGYAKAVRRRDYVLGRMLKLGMITEEQLEGARRVRPEVRRDARPFRHPHYCDWYLGAKCGRDPDGRRAGGDFTSPLDEDIQLAAEREVNAAAESGGYASAAIVMKVAGGDVVALACSGDYFDGCGGQVNTALARRPAGSTLKPLLAAQAMDLRYVTPDTVIEDLPMAVKGYRPANFDGKYRGEVTLRESLIGSLNVPFVKLLQSVGPDRFVGKLREVGFSSETIKAENGLSLAIGTGEVSLMELVDAYRRLASGDGLHFSRRAAHEVTAALAGPERSAAAFGHVADAVLPQFAWKTGTSSAYRDAWTVMWNPEYVVGVWCGHLRGSFGDRKLTGAKAAAPVAWRIARTLYPRGDGPWFADPCGPALRPVARLEPPRTHRAELAIASPEDGSEFTLVPGMPQQRIVCTALGGGSGAELWWFVDGELRGVSAAAAPFTLEVAPGVHRVTCASASGADASVTITVRSF